MNSWPSAALQPAAATSAVREQPFVPLARLWEEWKSCEDPLERDRLREEVWKRVLDGIGPDDPSKEDPERADAIQSENLRFWLRPDARERLRKRLLADLGDAVSDAALDDGRTRKPSARSSGPEPPPPDGEVRQTRPTGLTVWIVPNPSVERSVTLPLDVIECLKRVRVELREHLKHLKHLGSASVESDEVRRVLNMLRLGVRVRLIDRIPMTGLVRLRADRRILRRLAEQLLEAESEADHLVHDAAGLPVDALSIRPTRFTTIENPEHLQRRLLWLVKWRMKDKRPDPPLDDEPPAKPTPDEHTRVDQSELDDQTRCRLLRGLSGKRRDAVKRFVVDPIWHGIDTDCDPTVAERQALSQARPLARDLILQPCDARLPEADSELLRTLLEVPPFEAASRVFQTSEPARSTVDLERRFARVLIPVVQDCVGELGVLALLRLMGDTARDRASEQSRARVREQLQKFHRDDPDLDSMVELAFRCKGAASLPAVFRMQRDAILESLIRPMRMVLSDEDFRLLRGVVVQGDLPASDSERNLKRLRQIRSGTLIKNLGPAGARLFDLLAGPLGEWSPTRRPTTTHRA